MLFRTRIDWALGRTLANLLLDLLYLLRRFRDRFVHNFFRGGGYMHAHDMRNADVIQTLKLVKY